MLLFGALIRIRLYVLHDRLTILQNYKANLALLFEFTSAFIVARVENLTECMMGGIDQQSAIALSAVNTLTCRISMHHSPNLVCPFA